MRKIRNRGNREDIEMINEHDQTKRMLDVMRYGLIKEQEEIPEEADEESSDTITISAGDSIYNEEQKKLGDSIDTGIKINRFKIYPNDSDVQLDGRLNSGINFFLSVKAVKLMISITDEQGEKAQIYLDDDLLRIIQKLTGYYTNWKQEWGTKLTTEYRAKQNETNFNRRTI